MHVLVNGLGLFLDGGGAELVQTVIPALEVEGQPDPASLDCWMHPSAPSRRFENLSNAATKLEPAA